MLLDGRPARLTGANLIPWTLNYKKGISNAPSTKAKALLNLLVFNAIGTILHD